MISAFYLRLLAAGKPKKRALAAFIWNWLTTSHAIARNGIPWPVDDNPATA